MPYNQDIPFYICMELKMRTIGRIQIHLSAITILDFTVDETKTPLILHKDKIVRAVWRVKVTAGSPPLKSVNAEQSQDNRSDIRDVKCIHRGHGGGRGWSHISQTFADLERTVPVGRTD